MIQVHNLKFKYPGSLHYTLDIPKFHLEKKQRVFIYGPSGCGKTTFLEILAGVLPCTEGEIKISETLVSKLNSREKDHFRANHIGYIFQNFNLIPYLNVLDNITLPLYLSPRKRLKIPLTKEKEKTLELCQSLGLENLLSKNVTQLSVGQQQRVAAARAILGDPELILADEPTSSLDIDHREKFIQLLFNLCDQHQISVLFVSHDRTLEKLFHRSISLTDINRASSRSGVDDL